MKSSSSATSSLVLSLSSMKSVELSSKLVDITLKFRGYFLASEKKWDTNLTEYNGINSRAPELTLLTTGVNPHELALFTIIPSTPINMALRKMLPKF